MARYATGWCDCKVETAMSQKRPTRCEHGYPYVTEKSLNPPERKPLARISEKRQAEIDAGQRPRRNSTLSPGRGFAVAPAQRAKVKLLVCVGCGREVDPDEGGAWTIDPAHLVPRGAGGCDDPRCVAPLCRHLFDPGLGCHRAYDLGDLDLHGKLVDRGYFKEMAHAIEVHELSPLELVHRLTGELYVPKRELDAALARVVELEAGVAA